MKHIIYVRLRISEWKSMIIIAGPIVGANRHDMGAVLKTYILVNRDETEET